MLQLLLLIVIFALPQLSCATEKEMLPYKPIPVQAKAREKIEREKRELIQMEDLVVGQGAIAAWGRKIAADIEVRYTDGTLAFHGLIYDYVGFEDDVFLHNDAPQREEPGMLAMNQRGIVLGLNGMAIGDIAVLPSPHPWSVNDPIAKGTPGPPAS